VQRWPGRGRRRRIWTMRRWSPTSTASTRTWPRTFFSDSVSGRVSCFVPTTTGLCRRWSRPDWAWRWRRCSRSMRSTRRFGSSSSPNLCLLAWWSWSGIGIGIVRRRRRPSSKRRSRSRRRSSASMPRFFVRWSGGTVSTDHEHQLEPVDLVVLRPDLDEAEAADDRQRWRVGGSNGGKDFRFTLCERPPHKGAGSLFGVAPSPKSREDRVADLGAADDFWWAVKAAVTNDVLVSGDHEAGHPLAAVRRCVHAV